MPPPAGVKSPALWGTADWMEKTFARGGDEHRGRAAPCSTSATARRSTSSRSSATYYGPMLKAFDALDAVGQKGLARDLLALIGELNKSGDGTMVVPSEYLEVVVTKR